MTRILLYGGCHAQVLRDCLISGFDPGEISVDLLINFELIRSNQPFPLDRLAACDAVVFSPIENKGIYNTEVLLEDCRRMGKLAICFPWMEWHGYCPGSTKGLFKDRHQWFYPRLLEIASGFDDFESFRDEVIAHFPDDEVIDSTFLTTSERLASSEQRHAMPVRLSDFVRARYRQSRLFLISDHPSRKTYAHMLVQILDLLGLPFRDEMLVDEPQWQWRTPIFPRVAERLGLDFDDRAWADDMLVPGGLATLETYLRLYFHADSVVLGPRMHADMLAEPQTLSLDCSTRVLAAPLDRDERTGTERYTFLATLAGPTIELDMQTPFSIEPQLWRCVWDS